MGITLILGPMFSEKTTTMLSKIHKYTFTNKKCLVIKYKNDKRYTSDETIKTHGGLLYIDNIICDDDLNNINADSYDIIGIDEGQFFKNILTAHTWALAGKVIIISALDGDFAQNIFKNVADIIPYCNSIIKMNGICMVCKENESIFTIRKNNDKRIELIGGEDTYKSVCRQCLT